MKYFAWFLLGVLLFIAGGITIPWIKENIPTTTPKLQLAQQLIDVSGLKDVFYKSMDNAMQAGFVMNMPRGAPPGFIKVLEDEALKMVPEMFPWESVKQDMAKIYAEEFDADELQAFVDFYQSKRGVNVMKKLPAVMARGMKWGQERAKAEFEKPEYSDRIKKVAREYVLTHKEEFPFKSRTK